MTGFGAVSLPKKQPRERVQLEAPSADVADWKREAELLKITFSEFIRRACRRYSARRKKLREEDPPKKESA
jgi:hypothetical protein